MELAIALCRFVLQDERIRRHSYATMFSLQTRNPKSWQTQLVFSFKTRHEQVDGWGGAGQVCFSFRAGQ